MKKKVITALITTVAVCTMLGGCGPAKDTPKDVTDKEIEEFLDELDKELVEELTNEISNTTDEASTPVEEVKVSPFALKEVSKKYDTYKYLGYQFDDLFFYLGETANDAFADIEASGLPFEYTFNPNARYDSLFEKSYDISYDGKQVMTLIFNKTTTSDNSLVGDAVLQQVSISSDFRDYFRGPNGITLDEQEEVTRDTVEDFTARFFDGVYSVQLEDSYETDSDAVFEYKLLYPMFADYADNAYTYNERYVFKFPLNGDKCSISSYWTRGPLEYSDIRDISVEEYDISKKAAPEETEEAPVEAEDISEVEE